MNRKNLPKAKGVFYIRDLLASSAYWELNGTAIKVMNIFYLKRRIADHREAKKMNVPTGTIKNNGQIVFKYSEAQNYGISKDKFTRSLDKLIEVGFIDIAEPGGQGIPSKYTVSDRWQDYKTDETPKVKRTKRKKQLFGSKTRFN